MTVVRVQNDRNDGVQNDSCERYRMTVEMQRRAVPRNDCGDRYCKLRLYFIVFL